MIKHRIAAFVMSVVLLCGIVCAENLPGEPFPAETATWTSEIRRLQEIAGEQLQKALDSAVARGEKSFRIAPGQYRFSNVQTGVGGTGHFFVRNAKDMIIDGQGSTFWFSKQSDGLKIVSCRNTTLQNLQIDWDPLPFTQGRIVALDEATKNIEVRIDAGYEKVTEGFMVNSATRNQQIASSFRGALFDRTSRRLKLPQIGFRIEPFWADRTSSGTYRVKIAGFQPVSLEQMGFRTGDLIAMWMRGGYGTVLSNCTNVRLKNVTLFASPFICYSDAVGGGGTIFDHCNILRRPGTNRLMGGNADGFNSQNNERGPTLDGCKIDTIGDDFVNVHGHLGRVLEQINSSEIITSRLNFRDNLGENSVVSFYQRTSMKLIGAATIRECGIVEYTPEKGRCAADLDTRWYSGEASSLAYGKKVRAHKLVLDREIELPADAILLCEKFVGRGAVIKNCDFAGSLARGILVQGPETTIADNVFREIKGSVIEIGGSPGYWGEGGVVKGCVISGNTFDLPNFTPAIHILGLSKNGTPEYQSDMIISGNTFRSPVPVVTAHYVRNLQIETNKIQNPQTNGMLEKTNSPYSLHHVIQAKIDGSNQNAD